MAKLKVLYIVHGHPTIRPGGAETYSLELYEAMRASADFCNHLQLARSGPPVSISWQPHEGTLITKVGPDPHQYSSILTPMILTSFT